MKNVVVVKKIKENFRDWNVFEKVFLVIGLLANVLSNMIGGGTL